MHTINVTNISSVGQSLDKFWILPQETVAVPLDVAMRYQNASDFSFDWKQAEQEFTPSIVNNELKGLAFATPLSLFDGYGLIGVYTVREFIKQGVDLDLYMTGWLIEQDLDTDILSRLNDPKKFYNLALAKGPPGDVLPLIPARNKVSYAMWESDRLPPEWVPMLNDLPLNIVPTQAQVQIYRDSGVIVPISVVPDPIDTNYWGATASVPDQDHFKIVSWSRMTSRKMPVEMVQTFMRAFPRKDYPDVRFELKTNGGHFGGGGRFLPKFEDPRITIHNGVWSLDVLRSWVGSAHCAYFLSHGEGMFNPPMQAMAMGVPTILPNHTGPADFCDERYNYPVNTAGLIESPMGDNMRWWNPDLDHAIERLREVYHNYSEAKKRAKAGKQMIKRRYNVPLFVERLSKELVKL